MSKISFMKYLPLVRPTVVLKEVIENWLITYFKYADVDYDV